MSSNGEGQFVSGLVLGSSVTAVIAVALIGLSGWGPFVDWLNKWQTLITGVIAFIGAVVTVAWLQKQIDQMRSQEIDNRERRHFAARAMMPHALAELVEYSDACLKTLRQMPGAKEGKHRIEAPEGWKPPRLPHAGIEAVNVLITCIETADTVSREEIRKLVADLQVLHSNLQGLIEDLSLHSNTIVTVHNMHHLIANALEFHVRCQRMFPYARGEQSALMIEIKPSDILNRAVFADLGNYPGFPESVERYFSPHT